MVSLSVRFMALMTLLHYFKFWLNVIPVLPMAFWVNGQKLATSGKKGGKDSVSGLGSRNISLPSQHDVVTFCPGKNDNHARFILQVSPNSS